MKRGFLQELGLADKDTIDAIMAENGKDIQAEQDKANGVTAERDALKTQLEEANKTIEGYQGMDIEAIKKSAQEWEQKATENAKALEQVRQEAELDRALANANSHDTEMLKKALNRDELIFKDGQIPLR